MSTDVATRTSFDVSSSSTPKASMDNSSTPSKPVQDAPPPLPTQDGDLRGKINAILHSDIGIQTLLTRLKQSISSARECSNFFKERALLEERHFHGINRLTRTTHELLGRPDSRQGSFAFNYREIGTIHEAMARNSEEFTHVLMIMADELQEVAIKCERDRKHWKHTGLEAEARAQDADMAHNKAKQRYYSLAEQYDRARTGERQSGKFGLKTKSAAAQEESLLNKAENADQEYRARVETAQAQWHELINSSRPQAVRELQNVIMECDAAVSMQLQKFAVMNEKLLLGNGICVSPLKTQDSAATPGSRSLREVVQDINNQRDFNDFVMSHSGKVGSMPPDIKYEKHSALLPMPQQQQQQPPLPQQQQQQQQQQFQTQQQYPPRHQQQQQPPFSQHQHQHQQHAYQQQPPQQMPGSFDPPRRSDTGFGSVGSGFSTQVGQTVGVPSGHSPQQGQHSGLLNQQQQQHQHFQPQQQQQQHHHHHHASHSQHSVTSPNPPQLPQIGALGNGPKNGHDVNRADTFLGQGENENRNFSGPPQQRQSQQPYSGMAGNPNGPTVNQQVTSPFGPIASGRAVNEEPRYGAGRGTGADPTHFASEPLSGQHEPLVQTSFGQGQPIHNNRGPSFGQSSDIRPEGNRIQQAPDYSSQQVQHKDTRGLPSQMNHYGAGGLTGAPGNGNRAASHRPNLPPLRPCFGVPLDELFRRDGAAVPAIVYQCVQAVDLFGLTTEGIYRISGSAQNIMELQALFDHDASQVDFRTRAAFYNDIASVTTLLKHFLRDLPDPLLTATQYNSFIKAAKIDDEIVRRDSLHAIINSLPDPNYATLRTLVLHLNRVAHNSAQNRMTHNNIAIVFGPTLMGGRGAGPTGEIEDAGWQARVIETILHNTLQIFDDDD